MGCGASAVTPTPSPVESLLDDDDKECLEAWSAYLHWIFNGGSDPPQFVCAPQLYLIGPAPLRTVYRMWTDGRHINSDKTSARLSHDIFLALQLRFRYVVFAVDWRSDAIDVWRVTEEDEPKLE